MTKLLLNRPAHEVAPQLLGRVISTNIDDVQTSGIICEVEAYEQGDPASHSYRGETMRNTAMFSLPGTIYVYLSYGMHLCCNIVTNKAGCGDAVLIRGIIPLMGKNVMWNRRYGEISPDQLSPVLLKYKWAHLADGPGKAAKALGISMVHNGSSLEVSNGEISLEATDQLDAFDVEQSTRIGISKGTDTPWRWYITSLPKLN